MKIEDIYPTQIVTISNERCWAFYCGKPLKVISTFETSVAMNVSLQAEDGTIIHQNIKHLEPYKEHIIKD